MLLDHHAIHSELAQAHSHQQPDWTSTHDQDRHVDWYGHGLNLLTLKSSE